MKKILLLMVVVVALLVFMNKKDNTQSVTDYGQLASWIVLDTVTDRDFDVFFMHPTTYLDTVNVENDNLNNPEINENSRRSVARQASAFQGTCRLFAPYYQQMSMAYLDLSTDSIEPYLSLAEGDMCAAFKYYMDSLNKGRPYIIAGHSQGSKLIINYLTEHPNLVDSTNLVGVYAIGYTVTQENIDSMGIPFEDNSTQTPCVITWNTISLNGISPVIIDSTLCVNPLSWDNTSVNQDKSKDSWARIQYNSGEYAYIEHFTSAQIGDKGALVIPDPEILDSLNMSMGDGVYHTYDYDFFYGNIVTNVDDRCQEWLNKHPNYKETLVSSVVIK